MSALVLSLVLIAPAGAGDAMDILSNMSRAMQEKSYTGTYVYLHGSKLETLQIRHLRDENGEYERLVSLNGEAREIIRDNNHVTCIWPGSKSVIVSKSSPRTPFAEWVAGKIDNIERWYELVVLGEDRVANREATVIGIIPRDNFRYGHKLWVDSHNALLLGSQMLDERGVAVEQVMFTQMSLTEDMRMQQFVPSLTDTSYEWQQPAQAIENGRFSIEWSFAELPAGFAPTSESVKSMGKNSQPTHHVTLSDGLASVSVYVEQRPAGELNDALYGESQMGAVSAFGLHIAPIHVTVVGEVPMATAAAIGRSIHMAANGG